MDRGFIEDGFIVDLTNAKNAANLIFELSRVLEMPEAKGKKICLKIGSLDLKQAQLLSIKSLLEAMGNELAFIDTSSELTENSAVSLGVIVSELKNEVTNIVEAVAPIVDFEDSAFVNSIESNSQEKELTSLGVVNTPEHSDLMDNLVGDGVEFTELEIPNVENENDSARYIPLETDYIETFESVEEDVEKIPTLYLEQTLRSGQTISYDGNIVVIGDAHPGSELVARGDITVWGVLGGIAHAGSKGNNSAKIRALKLNAIQLRIGGYYASRRDIANIPYIQKTNEFTPEEARVINNQIVTNKIVIKEK